MHTYWVCEWVITNASQDKPISLGALTRNCGQPAHYKTLAAVRLRYLDEPAMISRFVAS